jgi:hypothetical protein
MEIAETFAANPALLRLHELDTLAALGKNANARLYIGVDKGLVASDLDGP